MEREEKDWRHRKRTGVYLNAALLVTAPRPIKKSPIKADGALQMEKRVHEIVQMQI